MNDTTLASDNPIRFRNNVLEWIQKLLMTNENKIRDETLQYDIDREAATLSPGIITYSSFGKDFEKQKKTIEPNEKYKLTF